MGGGHIFSGHIDVGCAAPMMVGMLAFAMSFEFLTNVMEEKAARSKAALEMVHKVYRELMILGFIGFTFIMSKERGLAASPSYIHCFEFCDLMVTIVVFLYTASTAIAAFFMHVSRRQWDRYTLMPTQLVCDKLKEHFEGVDGSMLGKLKHWLSYDESWRNESDFKMAELLFKQQFHLDRTFDYCLYISLVLDEIVVDLANISPYHWLFVCFVSLVLRYAAKEVLAGVALLKEEQETTMEWLPDVPDLYNPEVDSSNADAAGGSRRRLGGAALSCEAVIPCGLNASELQEATGSLFDDFGVGGLNNTALNSTNGTAGLYNLTCSQCQAEIKAEMPTAKLAIYGFIATGWLLLGVQIITLRFVSHRMNLISKWHGAKNPRNLPTLLEHLEKHLKAHTGHATVDVGHDEEDEGITHDGKEAGEDSMMHFHRSGKDANDVMSWRLFRYIMGFTKLIMVLNCFHFAFYVCHIQFRVAMFHPDNSFWISSLALFPNLFLVGAVFPKSTRKISLLVGILHLQHDAVLGVHQRMELVVILRDRIKDRLANSRIVKGAPQLEKGQQLLNIVSGGEKQILRELNEMDQLENERKHKHSHNKDPAHIQSAWSVDHTQIAGDHTDLHHRAALRIQKAFLRYKAWITEKVLKNRIRREKCEALLRDYDTHHQKSHLEEFLSRETFDKVTQMDQRDHYAVVTAKTLQTPAQDDPSQDTIVMAEYHEFIVRAIAEAITIAHEHGIATDVIESHQQEVIEMSKVVDEEQFANHRLLSKATSMFNRIDRDGSGECSKREFKRALRRYNISISADDFDVIWTVIDPDETQDMTLQEWLSFMMANEQDLIAKTLKASFLQMKANAEKGGEGLWDVTAYGSEILTAVFPGGETVVGMLTDPFGTTQTLTKDLFEVVTSTVKDTTDIALDVVGLGDESPKKERSHYYKQTETVSIAAVPDGEEDVANPVFETEGREGEDVAESPRESQLDDVETPN